MSAAVNLLDLSLGRSARLDPDKAPAEEARDGVPIEIHIVDERDGYCEITLPNISTLADSNSLH